MLDGHGSPGSFSLGYFTPEKFAEAIIDYSKNNQNIKEPIRIFHFACMTYDFYHNFLAVLQEDERSFYHDIIYSVDTNPGTYSYSAPWSTYGTIVTDSNLDGKLTFGDYMLQEENAAGPELNMFYIESDGRSTQFRSKRDE